MKETKGVRRILTLTRRARTKWWCVSLGAHTLGVSNHELSDLDTAIENYTSAPIRDPKYAEAYNNQGIT